MDGQTYGRAATTTTTASASSDGDDDDDGKKIIDKKEQWHVARRQIRMGTGARLDDAVARAFDDAHLRVLAPTDDSTFESIDRSIVRRRPQSTTRRWTRRRCARRRDANEPAVERDGAMGVDRRRSASTVASTVAARRVFVPLATPTNERTNERTNDDERRATTRERRTTTDDAFVARGKR